MRDVVLAQQTKVNSMADETKDYDGVKNYQTYTGEAEADTEDTYEVQSRKKSGKYQTHLVTKKPQQAMMHYQSRNVGPGYTKRMMLNGKLYKRTFG